MRFGVSFDAEYRGSAPARDYERFKRDADGNPTAVRETAHAVEVLKFEQVLPDGDIDILEMRVGPDVDQAADFDVKALKRGEDVAIVGIIADGRYGMYLRPTTIRRKGIAAKVG